MKVKKIFIILIVLLFSIGFFGCSDNDDINNDITEEIRLLNEYKATSITSLNDFMSEFNNDDYTEENWNHIQTLLLNTINNINSASSQAEIDNYVLIYKTTINLVSKKPGGSNTEPIDVSDEVWKKIEEGMQVAINAFFTEDVTLKLVSQLPIEFEYVNKSSENMRYLHYNANNEYMNIWLVNDEATKILSDLYIDWNITDYQDKVHLDLAPFEELINVDSLNIFIPLIEKFLNANFDTVMPVNETNEEKAIFESSMVVNGNKTEVFISFKIADILNKYPEVNQFVTTDINSIDMMITLEGNSIQYIELKPVSNNTLELLDKVYIHFDNNKLDYVNITTGMSGITISLQLNFDYKNVIIPTLDTSLFNEFGFDASEIVNQIRFYQLAIILKESFYNSKNNNTDFLEEVTNKMTNDYVSQLMLDFGLSTDIYYNEELDVLYVVNSDYIFISDNAFGNVIKNENISEDFYDGFELIE